jgi:competence protein ComEC
MGGRGPSFWQAPLAPVALAATAGILADRYANAPLALSLATVVACLAAWAATGAGQKTSLSLLYLLGSVAALGAAYHHWHREVVAADDIGYFATEEPRPAVLRGVLVEEPIVPALKENDPLRSFAQRPATLSVLAVSALKQRDDWVPISGLARLSVNGVRNDVHVGDEVDVIGRLSAPAAKRSERQSSPERQANPGQFDYSSYLRDKGIRALVQVHDDPESVKLLADRTLTTAAGWLARIRGWAHRGLEELLPREQQGLAMALLLGEDWMLEREGWERYARTGVIHVLAISGQHLAILAVFLWYVTRVLGLRRHRAACLVALFLLGYALLTGGRPPVMRGAVMICALCGGLLLRRPVLTANTFALSWLVVGILSPTDFVTVGCQLSFLAVAVLIFGLATLPRSFQQIILRLRGRPGTGPDPLLTLIEESRPPWERRLRWLAGRVAAVYGVTLAVWLALAPLIAARTHIVSAAGLIIGPPVVLLTTIALIAGFLALLIAPLCWPLAQCAAWPTTLSLAGCDVLVSWSEGQPGAYWYVSDIPAWWLWVFYLALLAGLTVPLLRQRWRPLALALVAWLCVGLVAGAVRHREQELRCTFLAVGHGGCTVLETPDGRTLLYDAGTLSGPDVTRKYIAPYLWSRGIRRIDEVFISHAHLDHYNGLVALLDRFAVGQVSCTPTFTDRGVPGAALTVETLRQRGIPMRTIQAGDRLSAGDVSLEVLHPPPVRLHGTEDVRSLVLLVRHQGHSILLTGDLEVPGQQHLFASVPRPVVDVLQAPHHGSRKANNAELAHWARPKVVVSCQGPPIWPAREPDPYLAVQARRLTTWEHGAVTFRSGPEGLMVETFRTQERWMVSAGQGAGK